MKKTTTSRSAFFYVRPSIGLALLLAGVFLALMSVGQFSAQAEQEAKSKREGKPKLVPPLFDCSQLVALSIDKQENLRSGAIALYCGTAKGGSPVNQDGVFSIAAEVLSPLLGGTDEDVISPGPESGTHITQSETFVAANPDNPNEIVVAYNDSRTAASNNFSGASVSTDGGNTYTRLTKSTGASPFANTFGDPVVLYQRTTGTWFTVWIDVGCGSQGMGGYKSTTPADPNSWTHFCVHTGSFDDRNSGAVDNNPSSSHYGRMYISWNDFNRNSGLFVRFSDNGTTWTEKQITSTFIRDVQLTVDRTTGTVFLAGMDEQGGGLTNRINKMYRSTDGGSTWTNTYSGPSFAGPGRTTCPNSYFACMFSTPQGGYWRHMGWGQPVANNGVVHYIYDSRNTGNGDPGNVFYIRSTDNGSTFSAPFQLNTDSTTKGQWQPSISIGDDNSLLAVWYDERGATAACSKGNTSVPCYQMFARQSTDGGATWGPDSAFSDEMTPLPGQPDPFIITEYAGDYDYSLANNAQHIHTWTDGRVPVSGAAQQDVFTDRDPAGGGGGEITLTAEARRQEGHKIVALNWSPADGGSITIMRNGNVLGTTDDDGQVQDRSVDGQIGQFDYQVCETDSGDCSNIARVRIKH